MYIHTYIQCDNISIQKCTPTHHLTMTACYLQSKGLDITSFTFSWDTPGTSNKAVKSNTAHASPSLTSMRDDSPRERPANSNLTRHSTALLEWTSWRKDEKKQEKLSIKSETCLQWQWPMKGCSLSTTPPASLVLNMHIVIWRIVVYHYSAAASL